jgi:conjugative relaxase-like TrwC/TraI family protein
VSLAKTAPGAAQYYIEYAVEGSERPGEWMGEGAKQLGLIGQIEPAALHNLFKGLHPDGSRQLVRLDAIRKDLDHAPAWDLCLSPPKDVSLVAALFDDLKEKVDLCQRRAVGAAVEYAEKEAAFVRRGSGGARLEKAKLVIAAFEHHTSRNDDPQKHTHLLVLNAAAHSDGFGTIVSKFIYDKQTAIQNVYLATLAAELKKELGVTIEAVEPKPFEPGEAFNIAGVPDSLRKLMSSRRAEILSFRNKFGITTARGMERANHATRREKTHLPPSVLRPAWKKTAETVGVDLAAMKEAILKPATAKQQPAEENEKTEPASQQTEGRKSPASNVRDFPPRQDTAEKTPPKGGEKAGEQARETAEEKAGERTRDQSEQKADKRAEYQTGEQAGKKSGEKTAERTTASARPEQAKPEPEVTPSVAASMMESIARSALAAKLPDPVVNRLIDHVLDEFDRKQRPGRIGAVAARTEEAIKALPQLLKDVDALKTDEWHVVHRDDISRGVAGKLTTREADLALVKLLESGGAIACVDAKAGVDVNQFVQALARQYQDSGFKVKAFTATPTAASELQTAIGLPVNTVGQLLPRLKTGPLEAGLHHATQILREAVNKSTTKLWSFTGQTVVLVTQAQTLRTADLAKIIHEANAKNAKVVLVGSSSQQVRREPHCAYEEVAKRLGGVITLPEPAIQKQEWMSDAAKQAARGDARGAYSQYALAGRLHLAPDQRAATIEMARHWASLSKKEQNGKTLMIADSARDARVLNKMAQESRRKTGLPKLLKQKVDGTWVRKGDRVLFRGGSKHHGIRAGDMGSIEKIGLTGMRVRLDRTRWALLARPPVRIHVPKKLYRIMSLGYAVTAADAQGMQCDTALVLPKAGGDNVRGLGVQLASGREDTRIFTSVRSVGEDIEAIQRSFRPQADDEARKRQQTEKHPQGEAGVDEAHEKREKEREHRQEQAAQHAQKLRS